MRSSRRRPIKGLVGSLPRRLIVYLLRVLARRAYHAKLPALALGLLDGSDRLGGADSWSRSQRGALARKRGCLEEATRCYEDAVRWEPANEDALHRLAELYLQQGEDEKAVATAERLRDAGAVQPDLAFKLALFLLEERQDHASALPWFEVASAAGHPLETWARLNKAHCLRNLERPGEARHLYEELVREGAGGVLGLRSRIGAAMATGDCGDEELAVQMAKDALREYETLDDRDELDDARAAVELLETRIDERRIREAVESSEVDEAERRATRLFETGRLSCDLSYELGVLLGESGRREAAVEWLRRAQELCRGSDWDDPRLAEAFYLGELRRLSEAEPILAELCSESREDRVRDIAAVLRVKALWHLGRPADAVVLFAGLKSREQSLCEEARTDLDELAELLEREPG
jgi:tetratricopeptide (TPR) repeat protein